MPNHEDEIINDIMEIVTSVISNSVYADSEREMIFEDFRQKLGQLTQAAAYADQPTLNSMLILINNA